MLPLAGIGVAVGGSLLGSVTGGISNALGSMFGGGGGVSVNQSNWQNHSGFMSKLNSALSAGKTFEQFWSTLSGGGQYWTSVKEQVRTYYNSLVAGSSSGVTYGADGTGVSYGSDGYGPGNPNNGNSIFWIAVAVGAFLIFRK